MTEPLGFLPEGPAREIARREIERAEPDVRALLVAGSYARGDASPGSDLDLYAILVDGEPSRFSAREEDGVLVERTAWDEATARRKIAANPMSWATFRDGRALRDDGVLSTLRDVAEKAAIEWRPSPEETAGCRHWLRASIVKVSAALDAGDEERAAWAAATSSFELARGLFLANGVPVPAAGAAWRELARLPDRPSDETLRRILLGVNARARCEAFLEAACWAVGRL